MYDSDTIPEQRNRLISESSSKQSQKRLAARQTKANPLISIIVPIFNEEEAISEFLQQLFDNFVEEKLELVLVNDGSVDKSPEILDNCAKNDPRIKIVHLSRNFGKEAAMLAGLDLCTGSAAIVMDADLQDPPEIAVEFVKKWREGYDIIYGVRKKRVDPMLKRFFARVFYRFFNIISFLPIPEQAGDFRLIDRMALDILLGMRERNRFLKGNLGWLGLKTMAVPFDRPSRIAGKTKYNFSKMLMSAIDAFMANSSLPLRVWGYIGGITSLATLIYALIIVGKTLLFGVETPGYASILTAVIFLGSVQLISLGIIGEYVSRVYSEVKNRPIYVVRKVVANGLDEQDDGHNKE